MWVFALDRLPSGAPAGLVEMPLRLAFGHEQESLAPWLRAHLDALGRATGVPLRLLSQKAVSERRIADVVAHDARDGSTVIVEAQLGLSDDRHAGQIVSYLAAVDAATAMWICPQFQPDHLAAARWMNRRGLVRFYCVELSLLQIGDAAPAALFNVVESPGGVSAAAATSLASATPLLGFAPRFWAEHLRRHPDEARLSRPVGEYVRWRETTIRSLVVALRVEAHAVSVFVRGRSGVRPEAAAAILAPFAEALEARLEISLNVGSGMLLLKSADSDEAGQQFQYEAGHRFRDEAGQGSDLMPAT